MLGSVVLAVAVAAQGDFFFEITRTGEKPDGKWGTSPLFAQESFDVWVWGTGADQTLIGALFNVGSTGTWEVDIGDVGTANPGGQFTLSNNGVIGFIPDTIFDVEVAAIPQGVAIGTSPATATKIYEGFLARLIVPGVVLDITHSTVVTGGGPGPSVKSYGIVETPSPSAACVGVLAGGWLMGRRRRP